MNAYISATTFFNQLLIGILMLDQGSLIKPNDPEDADFLSKNPDLIWGILIGVFLLISIAYWIYRKSKRQKEEESEE